MIYRDGSFDIVLETEVTAEELYYNGAYQILSFGPSLIHNGEITNSTNVTRGAVKKNNPRTAIGIVGDLHYIFVVCDGRTDESEGMTTAELAEFMLGLGAVTAYNLDGSGLDHGIYPHNDPQKIKFVLIVTQCSPYRFPHKHHPSRK